MNIALGLYNIAFELSEDENMIELQVESPLDYSALIQSLILAADGKESSFAIFDGDKEIAFDKIAEFVISPMILEINERKTLQKLYVNITRIFSESEYYKEYKDIECKLISLISNVVDETRLDITLDDEIDLSGLLKALEVKIACEDSTLAEKVNTFIKTTHILLNKRLFVFNDFDRYFTEAEISEIQKYMRYQGAFGIFITGQNDLSLHCNKKIIIDRDHCVIIC